MESPPPPAAPERTSIHRLDGEDPLTRARRAAVKRLRPRPEQEPYSSRAAVTLPAADADPHRTPFAVEHGSRVVGFGVLDAAGHLAELVDHPEQAALLRGFYIADREQGRGYGRAAARLVRVLVREVVPAARIVVLTVHEGNVAAIRAYEAAGFVTAGAYRGGVLGPERVMVAEV